MKTLKFLTVGLCIFGATLLVAETLPVRGPLSFDTYDKDNNKVITQKEFDAIKTERMTQKAQDGRLMRNAANSPTFSDIDTNSDGIISPKELQVHQQNRFTNRVNQQNKMMNKGMKNGMGNGMGMQNPNNGKGKNW
ncbi:MAG: hypothetical protein C0625_14795 [Arcobacter sp.]|nr:MAG: hypothetical protein C0625_14795 [Arcobacter sp.]